MFLVWLSTAWFQWFWVLCTRAEKIRGRITFRLAGQFWILIHGFRGLKSKSRTSGGFQVKASKINGVTASLGGVKHENDTPSSSPRTFINMLPDWSVLLAAITTFFFAAAEKQWMMVDWKPKRPDILMGPFGIGRIVQDGLVFRESFPVRSYEIGADQTASIETLLNRLQETALNHVKKSRLLGDGFGSTPEMCKKNLIWVVARMQVVVDRYPTWGGVVQVHTWVSASGKNGMRRDWVVSDSGTGEILTRASRHLGGVTWMSTSMLTNVKYIGWILESAPQSILESRELCATTLDSGVTEGVHLLRFEDGAEIVKVRTEWRPKHPHNLGANNHFPAKST
ncbi:hypothetical protein K1719_011658 [Acacia pycnantha]|nr:hypothetical protein K1719_011658 [Acacia pycnantha]